MESRAKQASDKKRSGKYNCSQAIACTYCDYMGVDEQTAFDMAQAFAVGMGTLEGNCGALTGVGLVLGLYNKDARRTMRDIRSVMTAFAQKNGTVTCKTLKGVGTGIVLRECPDCVYDAAVLLEQILQENEKPQ